MEATEQLTAEHLPGPLFKLFVKFGGVGRIEVLFPVPERNATRDPCQFGDRPPVMNVPEGFESFLFIYEAHGRISRDGAVSVPTLSSQ